VNYNWPLVTLKADTTQVFDIDEARKNQVPDASGNTIPLWATMGKFHWAPDMSDSKNSTVGLMGRMEVLSLQDQRASSFSCGIICDYQYMDGPYLTSDPGGLYPGPNYIAARNFYGTGDYTDGYGNYMQTTYAGSSIGLFGYDSSIINMSPAADTTMDGNSLNPGQTSVTWYEEHYYSYHYDDTLCVYQDNPQQISSPGTVPVGGSGHNAPLVTSYCPAGAGELTAGWGEFGGCSLSASVYSKGASDSCTSVGGPPSNPVARNCVVHRTSVPLSQSATGFVCQTICPVDSRIISNDCTTFMDGKAVIYTAGTTVVCN
jgi:hypothetical protein